MATDEKQRQSSDEEQTSRIKIDLGCYKEAEQKALLKACLKNKDLYLHSDGEAQQF